MRRNGGAASVRGVEEHPHVQIEVGVIVGITPRKRTYRGHVHCRQCYSTLSEATL